VDITILPRTLAVFDVAQAELALLSWLIRDTLLQWMLPRAIAWAQGRWLVHLVQDLLLLLLELLDPRVDMVDNTLADLQAPTLFHPVSELRLDLTQVP
jgi:hypothetical protein